VIADGRCAELCVPVFSPKAPIGVQFSLDAHASRPSICQKSLDGLEEWVLSDIAGFKLGKRSNAYRKPEFVHLAERQP
jgi:hypothetical protein